MPTEEVLAISGKPGTSASASRRIAAPIAILLFLLLCFTTVTVWVRDSWALQCFQIGIYSLVIVQLLAGGRRAKEPIAGRVFPLMVYLIPFWGLLQIVLHTTTATFETRGEVLRWGALAGVFYLTQNVTRTRDGQQKLLNAILCFATAMAILCLMQLNTSSGSILWLIPTDFSDIFATFQNKNNYVQFVELALPIALWEAVRQVRRSWWYALAAGVLYASAVGVASRAGFLLCTAEVIAVFAIEVVRSRRSAAKLTSRSAVTAVLIIPLIAAVFTLAAGWKRTLDRFKEQAPFVIRREYLLGAIEMAKDRPLTGYGLGNQEQRG